MNWTPRRERFRALLAGNRCVHPGSVFDPISARIGKHGVRICLQGHQPFMAAVNAVYDTLRALRNGTPAGKLTGLPSDELMKRFTRDADYARWTKEFLNG